MFKKHSTQITTLFKKKHNNAVRSMFSKSIPMSSMTPVGMDEKEEKKDTNDLERK